MSAATIPRADPDDTLDVLVKAREWLSDPAHWTQNTLWRDDTHSPVAERVAVACTCGAGALSYVVAGRRATSIPFDAWEALRAALGADSVSEVNDGPDGYARILAAYDRAIATERNRRGLA